MFGTQKKMYKEIKLLKYVHRNSLNHKNNSVQNVPDCGKWNLTQTLSDFWNQKETLNVGGSSEERMSCGDS